MMVHQLCSYIRLLCCGSRGGRLLKRKLVNYRMALSRPAPYLDILVNDQRQARHTTGLNHRSKKSQLPSFIIMPSSQGTHCILCRDLKVVQQSTGKHLISELQKETKWESIFALIADEISQQTSR